MIARMFLAMLLLWAAGAARAGQTSAPIPDASLPLAGRGVDTANGGISHS